MQGRGRFGSRSAKNPSSGSPLAAASSPRIASSTSSPRARRGGRGERCRRRGRGRRSLPPMKGEAHAAPITAALAGRDSYRTRGRMGTRGTSAPPFVHGHARCLKCSGSAGGPRRAGSPHVRSSAIATAIASRCAPRRVGEALPKSSSWTGCTPTSADVLGALPRSPPPRARPGSPSGGGYRAPITVWHLVAAGRRAVTRAGGEVHRVEHEHAPAPSRKARGIVPRAAIIHHARPVAVAELPFLVQAFDAADAESPSPRDAADPEDQDHVSSVPS